MRINSVLEVSEANGPGKRGVVWVQGCARHCAGCFNKETQNPDKGKDVSREYNDCRKWRVIADANNIDDPENLAAGTIVELPPLY